MACFPCGTDGELDLELLPQPLPPLPKPQVRQMRAEATGGVSLVLCLVGTMVSITVSFCVTSITGAAQIVLFVLIFGEAGIALVCLAGLMFGDPGVIRRSTESVLPMPDVISERLADAYSSPGGQAPEALRNLTHGLRNIQTDERTYCVRCLLWRDNEGPTGGLTALRQQCGTLPKGPRPTHIHHCSTCNRCVRHFDHHCGVFGRCIAGRGHTSAAKHARAARIGERETLLGPGRAPGVVRRFFAPTSRPFICAFYKFRQARKVKLRNAILARA